MKPTLSPRLGHLRSHHRQHESIWDIGCDHGKLGLSFLNERDVKEVHLVDPSPPVIKNLKYFIDSYITEEKFKIHIHENKGQDIVPGPLSKLILIAGMGGKEIVTICEHLRSYLSSDDDLVISPHRDILQVRAFLHSSSFTLGKESIVSDEGRFYQCISLNVRGGEKVPLYGREIFQGEVGEKYLRHQLAVMSAHQDVRSRSYADYLRTLTQRF
jgi:tRNA (adenine22-N1)-methyltransferase